MKVAKRPKVSRDTFQLKSTFIPEKSPKPALLASFKRDGDCIAKEKEKEIEIDIIAHEMVPKHEILSAEEKKALLEKSAASEKNFPKILDTDPVAKKISAKPGDVIKITRKSQTAGESVYYRIVAEKPKR